RTQINDVARQLGAEGSLDIGADLHILAATGCPELLHPGDVGQKPDAARTMDAAGHLRLDQRTEVLIADGPLSLFEPAAVKTVSHSLVLQIALTALVTNRAIERMVDQQEFHYSFLGPKRLRRFGVTARPIACGHRTRCYRLGLFLHFNQAHSAISSDTKPFVVAEMCTFDPGVPASLQDRGARRYFSPLPVDR